MKWNRDQSYGNLKSKLLGEVANMIAIILQQQRPIVLLLIALVVGPVLLTAQTSVGCSNGATSFEQYQAIAYPYLARRAGITANQTGELSISPGGEFSYKLDEPRFSLSKEIQAAIVTAMSGWRFQNSSGQVITLKLDIVFELTGRVPMEDDKIKNQIIFDRSEIKIKVISSRIIPNIG
jgi:hypothetical protein